MLRTAPPPYPWRTLILALAALLTAILLTASPAGAQRPDSLQRELDSLRSGMARLDSAIARDSVRLVILTHDRALDSLQRESRRLRQLRERTEDAHRRALRPGRAYALAFGLAVGSNYAFRWDTDPGGYRDEYLSEDKLLHFSVAHLLAANAQKLGVRRWAAVAITCAGGAAFEYTQARRGGFFSNRDAVVGCGGAALSAVPIERWVNRLTGGRP